MGIEQEHHHHLHNRAQAESMESSANSKLHSSNIDHKNEDSVSHKNLELNEESSTELLGSVTINNCPGVRTSARVIQKMKQDSVRCSSPPLIHDRKDLSKTSQQTKTSTLMKNTWSNSEKNLFFDALNEYGKDFDAIYNFIHTKMKKILTDPSSVKTKEQIRHSYYQTFHKLSKYIKFSEEVKKPVQELYALINYGEMRRKLAFVSEKNLMKLRELVYTGFVTVRSKGKSIRIKTPSCKALRKINQLEGWLEDIKLPLKVEVCLRPATMEAWGRVQNIAQNPVVKTIVPLQKKLVNIIRTFQYRWRSQETKMNETALKLLGLSGDKVPNYENENQHQHFVDEPLICFAPPKNATIHRPLVSITQYLSSFNICLNSYEERMGVKIRGETLPQQDKSHQHHHSKRQRTDSGSEKKASPESKKTRLESIATTTATVTVATTTTTTTTTTTGIENQIQENEKEEKTNDNQESSEFKDEVEDDILDTTEDNAENNHLDEKQLNDCLDTSINNIICLKNSESNLEESTDNVSSSNSSSNAKSTETTTSHSKIRKSSKKKDKESRKDGSTHNFRPFIDKEVLCKIRKGWTILNASDITIGDLYIVFGQDSKLMLEYYWLKDYKTQFDINFVNGSISNSNISSTISSISNVSSSVPYNMTGTLKNLNTITNNITAISTMTTDNNLIIGQHKTNNNINNSNQLITTTPEMETIEKISHDNLLSNKLKHLLLIANLNERIKRKQCNCGHICVTKTKGLENEGSSKSYVSNVTYSASNIDGTVFRQPMLPLRRTLAIQSFRQISNGQRKQSQYLRNGKIGPRQVVVQRLLPVQPGVNQSYDVVTPQLEIRTVQDTTNISDIEITTTNNRLESQSITNNQTQTEPLIVQNELTSLKSCATNTNTNIINSVDTNKEICTSNSLSSDNSNKLINSSSQFNDELKEILMLSQARNNIKDSSVLNNHKDDNDCLNSSLSTPTITRNNSPKSSMESEMEPDLSPLLELSLPSPLPLRMSSMDENTSDTLTSIPPMSPMQLLRDSCGDSKWLEENISDFSLTSFLGHLDDINNRDITDSGNMSVISESSVDYMSKFAEIASMQNEERDL